MKWSSIVKDIAKLLTDNKSAMKIKTINRDNIKDGVKPLLSWSIFADAPDLISEYGDSIQKVRLEFAFNVDAPVNVFPIDDVMDNKIPILEQALLDYGCSNIQVISFTYSDKSDKQLIQDYNLIVLGCDYEYSRGA